MNITASVPGISMLDDNKVQTIIKNKAKHLLTNKWIKQTNITNASDGTVGQFGYQKTNDDTTYVPKLYLVEVHVYKAVEQRNTYTAAILIVQIDEKTKTPCVEKADVLIKDGTNITVGSDIFNTTLRIDENEVIQFGNWKTLDDVIDARNEELIAQGKFTREEIKDMMEKDGYIHIIHINDKPRLTRDNKED